MNKTATRWEILFVGFIGANTNIDDTRSKQAILIAREDGFLSVVFFPGFFM
jgi:hypothetical protein